MKAYDVIIIGAGVTGAAIARELSRYKLRIAVLEKEEEYAFGVSKSNSGIIHPGTQNFSGSLKGRLCAQGNRLVRKIARELGVDFKQTGELIVAFNGEEAGRLRELKREAETLGVPGLRILDKRRLAEKEPNLSPEAVAALYAPTAGIISPYRLVYDLCENALKNGVEIHTCCGVQAVGTAGGGFSVLTAKGEFHSRFLVNAAGLFADDVAAMCGINDFRITPRKGEEFILDKKLENISRHLLFPLPNKISKGVLVIKTADGNPMIGPTAQDAADKEDLGTSDAGLKEALAGARRLIPSIDEKDIIAYFAGLRPAAGDDFIIRREEKVPGLVTVAGIQSPGLTAAPAAALMVRGLLRECGLVLKKKLFFRPRQSEIPHLFSLALKPAERLVKKDPAYGDIVCRCEMVSAKEVRDAVRRGACTMDGIKFRTRAQAGRCHGSFCTARIMRILAQERKLPLTGVSKRGKGSELVKKDRADV
ncbi:MAG: NAD(P)/FAD-dependent oxidoreductase [Candidatus Omnitrophota bacterium]|nr:NAD(P)/FAD-dependent oxidoreductase [Candidatus Omnitrophota bacterium]